MRASQIFRFFFSNLLEYPKSFTKNFRIEFSGKFSANIVLKFMTFAVIFLGFRNSFLEAEFLACIYVILCVDEIQIHNYDKVGKNFAYRKSVVLKNKVQ